MSEQTASGEISIGLLNSARRSALNFDVSVSTWWRWVKEDPDLQGLNVGGRTLWTREQIYLRYQKIVGRRIRPNRVCAECGSQRLEVSR